MLKNLRLAFDDEERYCDYQAETDDPAYDTNDELCVWVLKHEV